MKKFVIGDILTNNKLAPNVFSLEIFTGDIAKEISPGQFCSVYLDSEKYTLPRPISISETDKIKNTITLVFLVVGDGTKILSLLKVNDKIKLLLPLGNGYEIDKDKKRVALVGGGIGIPPLVELYKTLKETKNDIEVDVYLGFKDETFLTDKFDTKDLYISTDTGKFGFKGNVIELLKDTNKTYDIIYSCGPSIMLKSLKTFSKKNKIECFLSLEERMACSFGVCVGCVVKIKSGDGFTYKKVCTDGPVFNSLEVEFDD